MLLPCSKMLFLKPFSSVKSVFCSAPSPQPPCHSQGLLLGLGYQWVLWCFPVGWPFVWLSHFILGWALGRHHQAFQRGQKLLLLFSRSVVSNSLRPHRLQHVRLPCPLLSSGACLDSCPLSQWCHPTISYSMVPFSSYLHSFSASGSFPVSWLFAAAAAAKSLQSCPTLCSPIDGSQPGFLSLGFSRQEYWSGLPFPSPMHESEKWKWSHSVTSGSSRPHGLQPTSLPGSSVHRILQARVLEWGAIAFSVFAAGGQNIGASASVLLVWQRWVGESSNGGSRLFEIQVFILLFHNNIHVVLVGSQLFT